MESDKQYVNTNFPAMGYKYADTGNSVQRNKILALCCITENRDKDKVQTFITDVIPQLTVNCIEGIDLYFNAEVSLPRNSVFSVAAYEKVLADMDKYQLIISVTSLSIVPGEIQLKAKSMGIPFIVPPHDIYFSGTQDGYNGYIYKSNEELISKFTGIYSSPDILDKFKSRLLKVRTATKIPAGRKKKVIIVQGGFPSLSATFIMDQMTGLINRGYEVENWSTYKTESATIHPDVVKYNLLSVTRFIKFPARLFDNNTEQWVNEFYRLNNINCLDEDVIFHIHYGVNFNKMAPLFKVSKNFVMVSFHGYDASRYFKEKGDNCYNYLFERVNLITTPSEYMKYELTSRGCNEEKIKIHRCGINLDKFNFAEKSENKSKITFLTVGRFVEKKGIEYSLQAFARICNYVDAEYRIVGEGKLENVYRNIVKEYGIENKVIFTGPENKEEVAGEMKNADVFVLTSVTASDGDSEGLPVSLTEAHAAGLPVISTFHAGIPELVVDMETGLLTEEKDVEETAKNMLLLAQDKKLRQHFSAKARKRVKKEFDIEYLNDTLAAYLGGNAPESTNIDLEDVMAMHDWESRLSRYKEHFEYCTELKRIPNPAASVVIISAKMNSGIQVNLKLLSEQRENNFEIIIVNNGAPETEFEQIKLHINTYIKLNKNTNTYLARNIGTLFARADVLIFLDDDAQPAKDFVEMHLRLQNANKDIAAIRGKCLPVNEGDVSAPDYNPGETPIPYYLDLESNLSVKAGVFFKVGGFPDDINSGYGGAEFSYRLKKNLDIPEPVWYFPQPLILHDYIKDESHSTIKKQRQEESLKRIISIHNDFESYLAYYRTLKINMPEPEIIQAGDESLFNSNIFKVNWVITRKCNYQCSYCKVYDNKNGFFAPVEKLKLAVDEIAQMNKDEYIITITGGEPTIHPAYTEFIRYIYDKLGDKVYIVTITNLSRTKNFYETFSKEIAPFRDRFNFRASYHFEFAKTETFINNASILADNNVQVNISVLSHPEKMRDVKELYSGLIKLNPQKINCELILVRENFGTLPDKRYTAEDLAWLQDKYQVSNYKRVLLDRYYENVDMTVRSYYTAAELNIKGLHEYKGMICSAGDKMISIDQFGNVSPAVCFRGAKKFSANIYEGQGNLTSVKNVVCPFERCGCVADLQLPKYSAKEKPVINNIKNSNGPVFKDKLVEKNWLYKSLLYEPVFESAETLRKVTNPSASVIVISWRLHPDTIRNFEVLQKQRNQNFELIFVDNGGKPGEFNSLKPYVDTFIKLNKNTGAYLARNIGALFASAPLLLFLEDDGIPADNFIQAHLNAHRKYDIIALRGIYVPKTANQFTNYVRHYYLGPNAKSIYVNVEGNASYRADIFFKAGGWDDNINFGGGGPELAIRLLDIEPDKRKQIYTPDAIIYHDYAVDEKHFMSKREKQETSKKYLKTKHPDWDMLIFGWNAFFDADDAYPVKKSTKEKEIGGPVNTDIKISVCIPTYNRAEFLNEAINSVLIQQGNYEIVIVDDGSTDNTEQVVVSTGSDRIRYFKNERNMGRPFTRNRCIKEASGDYILWLDDDDLFMPFLLQEYFRILNDDPSIDVIYGNLQSFDNKTGKDLIYFSAKDYTNSGSEILKNIIDGSGITNLGSAIRKSLFEKHGYYDAEFMRAQDNEFWTRIAPYAKFYKLNKTIARYRKHDENVSIGGFIDNSYESKIIRKILNRYPLDIIYPGMLFDDAVFEAAMGLYKFGDYYNAIKMLELLNVSENRKFPGLFLDCLINSGEYKRVLEFKSANASVQEVIVSAHQKAGMFLKFRQIIEEAEKKNDYVSAGTITQQFIQHAAANFDVLFVLSKLLIVSGDKVQAAGYLKTALKYNPLSEECFNLLISLLPSEKDIESITSLRRRILEEIPMYKETLTEKSKKPLVSVIIITYNRKDKLPRAIRSVLEQSYRNLELIVVNDAGEDVSGIVSEFNDNRLRLINHESNRGLSAARNTGIKKAAGEYIAFLDDDDIYYPEHLDVAVKYLDAHDVIYTDAVRCNISKVNGVETETGRSVPYSIDYDRNKLLVANIAPVNCFVFRKDLTAKAGMFNEELLVLEDWDFWLRLSEFTDFMHIRKNTVQVNWVNDGSTMTSTRQEEFSKARNYIYGRYAKELEKIPNKEKIVAEFNAIWRNDFKKEPVVSIIALTYNQVDYTRAFVESVLHNTSIPFELILIDNNSSDSTPEYLADLAASNKNIKVILNRENYGFPKGINQGIKASSGKYILIANNDILVTENWLNRMVEAAESSPEAGLIGPVSNSVSGVQLDKEAKYSTIAGMFDYARKVSVQNKGKMFVFPRIAFLCTLIKKEVIEKIGGLDERFTPGNFEDDDFCLRAQLAGYKTIVLQDVFIHHFGSKSFAADGNQKYLSRLEANKQKFVNKWGADPEEIWLHGKPVNRKNPVYPINKNNFNEHFDRAVIQIEEQEYSAAKESLSKALQFIDEKGNSPVTSEDINSLLSNLHILQAES
jgi:glycosyltransferase involved in cell wall biosynthesis